MKWSVWHCIGTTLLTFWLGALIGAVIVGELFCRL